MVDPSEHTVPELKEALTDVDDEDELATILQAEASGKDRKTAKQAIRGRLDAIEDESADASADEAAEDPAEGEVGGAQADDEGADEADDADDEAADEADDDSGEDADDEAPEEGDEAAEEDDDGLSHPTADKRHVRALEDGVFRDMWVYCETQQGELIDVSKEMLGKARELMDTYNEDYDVSASEASGGSEDQSSGADEQVVAVLIGDGMADLTEDVVAYGADVVVYADDPRLERFLHTPYTEIFCDMARGAENPLARDDRVEYDWQDYDEPRYTVFPATNNGRDLSATVQAELDSGLASDCSDLFIEDSLISNPSKTGEPGTKKEFERILHMKRPDFSGFEYSTILCIDKPDREFHPQGASVIPGSFPLPEYDASRDGIVVDHQMELDDEWFAVEATEWDRLEGGIDLTGHDVIVGLGRGIGDDPTRGVELGLELVDAFEDADLGITRGIVTSSYEFEGHVDQYTREERQIGETGQVVKPDLYVAAGISGAIQHKVGVDEAETIVAINTDPEADIVDFSDYFIEGDLFEVLPALVDALEAGELDAAALADGGEPQ